MVLPAVLRDPAINPDKLAGVIGMFGAIIILVFLPWLDSARTRSSKYRPLAKQFFWMFVVVCIGLGYLGAQPPEGIYVIVGRILTVLYFAYFLILLPLLSRIEKPRPVPNSIADDVLAKSGAKRATMASAVIALLVAGGLFAGSVQDARAEDHGVSPPGQKWSFSGPFGKFDRGALQRGLKVYKEVCSACHGLSYVAFRNLADAGGPGYSVAQASAFASDYKVKDGPNDAGDMFERPGRPADYFPSPFPNEQAARAANGGAAPPDLSLITKARSYGRGFPRFLIDFFTQYQEQGPDYVDALLQGYEEKPPAGFNLPDGSYYNRYFPGHAIKMPKPLSDGQVTFDDGSPATVAQYAKDVTTFLMWTAEPHMVSAKAVLPQLRVPHPSPHAPSCTSPRKKVGPTPTIHSFTVNSEKPLRGLFCWTRHSGMVRRTRPQVQLRTGSFEIPGSSSIPRTTACGYRAPPHCGKTAANSQSHPRNLMGTSITFKRPDGKDAAGYLANAARGNAPCVVVIQEWWGLQDQIKGLCDRFAVAGFDALAPDLYKGTVVPYHDTDAAGKEMNSLDFMDATTQTVRGAVQYLSRNGAKVGLTGFCLGGAVTIIGATKIPELAAGVVFYGIPPEQAAKPADVPDSAAGAFRQQGRLVHAAGRRRVRKRHEGRRQVARTFSV